MISENDKKRIQTMANELGKEGKQLLQDLDGLQKDIADLGKDVKRQTMNYHRKFERFKQAWAFPVKFILPNPECAKGFRYLNALSELEGEASTATLQTILAIFKITEAISTSLEYAVKNSILTFEIIASILREKNGET
jgi:hypothetical protein